MGGKRYLRIDFEDLEASASWKSMEDDRRRQALFGLFSSVISTGRVPEAWKRVACVRTVGVVGKKKRDDHRGSPFRSFYLVWEEAWRARRGEEYVWLALGKGKIKTLFALCQGDPEKFRRKVERFFEDPWLSSRASIEMLHSRWNDLTANNMTPKVEKAPEPSPYVTCEICGWDGTKAGSDVCWACNRPLSAASSRGQP